jgi:hypothetical protein
VDHEAAALEFDQQVLRAPTDLEHALPGHGPLEAGLDRPAQPALAQARLEHAGAAQGAADAAPGGLDFREFGQGWIMRRRQTKNPPEGGFW